MDNFDPDAYLAGGSFDPDAYLKEEEGASWGTAFKQKLAEAGNAADAAISLPAGNLAGMFSQEEGDRIFKEMAQRRAANLQGANPNNQKLSTAQQVGGTVATLPAQLLGMFGAPAEKGMDLINRGESVGTAMAATLLDTAANVAGVAPMASAATFLGRAGIGASSNMAFGAGSDAATQLLAEKQSTKDAYDPYNVERRVVEGLTGGVLQGALGERPAIKSANSKVNKMVMEQMKREAPVAPKLDIEPIVDTKSSLDKTKEAYESAVRERELQRQSAFNRPEQLGNLEAEGPMSRMARDLGAEPGIPERTPSRMEQDLTSRPMTSEQMNAMNALEQRQRQAQESITRRQTELEQAVQRQASLDNNASMRQRQEAASAVSDAHRAVESERARAQSVLEDIRLAEESSKQSLRGNNPYGSDIVNMNSGIPFTKEHVKALMAAGKLVIKFIDGEYRAMLDGKDVVARLVPNISADDAKRLGEKASVDIVKVHPKLKGTGIGAALYKAWSNDNNGNITPSGKTSPDAWNLWKNKYPEKVAEFVQQEANRIKDGADRRMVLENISDPAVAKQVSAAAATEGKIPFNFRKQGGGLLISPKEKTGLDNALALSDDGTFIPKNPNVQEVVAKSLAEGKDGMSNKFTYLQSGATSAAMKTGSAAIKAASEIVQNAVKRADLAVRNAIFPAETALKRLSKADITELAEIFKNEMTLGKRFDADILMQNLTTKQLDAYTHMRDMFDKSLAAQNEARLAKGQDPISPNEAYMASRWSGDFRRPVHDANGKLVWYLAADSKVGLEAQTKALLKEFPTLVIDKAKDHQVRSTIGKTDLQSMYTTMLDILGRNDPAIDKIKAALEDQTTAETEMLRGQEKHFERKGNIRGFVGDRPGMNPGKEAIAMFEQQIQYAKNAFTWSEMQKAADDIKGIVSNPDLQAQQPNNVKYIREYFKNAIGHGEAKVMRALDDTMREGMGVSPKVLSEAVGDIKSFFIMQKLAASAGFALSNVIQSTNVIPYLADLHAQGYKGNAAKALGVGYSTGLMMAVSHYLKASGGEYVNKLPNQFLKDAIQYAEDNGVTARSIYDESPLGASFSTASQIANVAGKTMTIPETWVRSTAFMTYAQMLKDSGKYSDMSKLFQHAEELVNASMVDYRQTEKPLIFAKGGTLGNFLNTLQTYPMSFYNQYSYMVGQASNGNVLPLVAMVALQGAIAGAMGVPYAEDVYKAFKYVKDELVPTSTWKDMQDSKFLSDPKLWVMETLGNGTLYGALSDLFGLGMTSRVSAPSAGAMLQSPLGPITDLYKQGKSVGSALIDPTNPTKWAQAGMNVVPTGLSGLLETAPFMKDHTYIVKPNGEKVFMKTSDLAKRDASVSRTPEEVGIRKFGLRSQREVVEKDVKYMTDTANTVAKDRAKDLVEKIYNSARNGDAKKTKELTSLYTRLTGKELTDEQIDRQVKQEYLTGFQKSANKENMTPQEAINFARMRSILENSK